MISNDASKILQYCYGILGADSSDPLRQWVCVAPINAHTNMIVGALRIVLQIPESHSLKDKRQVVRSLLQRARNDFTVAAAEVGDTERWQIAELGFAYVSESEAHVNEVIDKVARFIEGSRPDLTMLDYQIELMELGV